MNIISTGKSNDVGNRDKIPDISNDVGNRVHGDAKKIGVCHSGEYVITSRILVAC